MAGGQYHLYPPNLPPGMSPQGVPIQGFLPQSVGMDYRMHMFPGGGVIPGGESSRESAVKYAEGFEQWYAPYRMQSAGHHIPAISYFQGQGRALEQSALDSRIPAHEALLKGGSGRVLTTDPVTGQQYYGPQQHSHSHLHTHFHIHPHEQQHLQNLQAAAATNLSSVDQAYLQHPGLSAWRNHPSLWQYPEFFHLHGNNARGIFPEELAHAHGLGSTPLDRQLQQQMMLSQQSKYHPQHMLAHEEFMRCWRQHNRAQQRLESEKMNDHLLSSLFKKEQRNLQSPSQLDNVVKKSMDSSGVYTSPSKKPPVTIDLSED